MKTKHLKWLLPLVLLPVLRMEVVAQTESETRVDTIVVSDTLRWTWTAKKGEVKDFAFSVTVPGRYQVWWGDGDMKEYNIPSGIWRAEHKYLIEGSYAVMVFGVEGPVFDDYTELALGLNMKMVYVEGGEFEMGATEEQGRDAESNEKPVHSVTLDGFYMGETEVTQAQWKAVMGTTVSQQRDKLGSSWSLYGVGDGYPIYYVSWTEAVQFCEKLSQMTGRTYRLPTEAEWEYAARGGQNSDGTKYAGSNNAYDVAWFSTGYEVMHLVGTKNPNGLGLYDMSGNVYEWCSDWFGSYGSLPAVNPQGPSSGSSRVIRGGSWSGGASYCRVSYRNYRAPGFMGYILGFRVACSLK